jgi:predicted nucleic acid-binding protein
MRAVFQRVETDGIQLYTTTLTLTEVLTKPLKAGDAALVKTYREFLLETNGLELIPLNTAVSEHAADLRARYNLRTPDAVQVATAIETRCQAFLTNDNTLRRVTELSILILDDLENT